MQIILISTSCIVCVCVAAAAASQREASIQNVRSPSTHSCAHTITTTTTTKTTDTESNQLHNKWLLLLFYFQRNEIALHCNIFTIRRMKRNETFPLNEKAQNAHNDGASGKRAREKKRPLSRVPKECHKSICSIKIISAYIIFLTKIYHANITRHRAAAILIQLRVVRWNMGNYNIYTCAFRVALWMGPYEPPHSRHTMPTWMRARAHESPATHSLHILANAHSHSHGSHTQTVCESHRCRVFVPFVASQIY